MSLNPPDTAYIQVNPNCIGEHAIKARGEIFAHIAKIAEEMGTVAQTASKDGANSPRKLKAGEWYQNVVSIFGERGSGKTILLLSACACLGKAQGSKLPPNCTEEDEKNRGPFKQMRQQVAGDILLPVVQPEYFGPEDTLLTWILTYLREYVEDKSDKGRYNEFKKIKIKQNEEDEDDDGNEPADFIEKMRKDEVLFSRKFSSNLAEQDVTADDFQLETLKVVEAQDRFLRQWRQLVNKLIVKSENRGESIATERKNHPFLIIPIDDADLNPAALPIILKQMQILQHPNVLFLFSVHLKSLESMMYISQLELNTNQTATPPIVNFEKLIKQGLRDVEDVRVDAHGKIDKFLPHKYRVAIQPLSPKDRLYFKPLIENKQNAKDNGKDNGNDNDIPTFLQLLEKIQLDIFDNNRIGSIAFFFDWTQSFKNCGSTSGANKDCIEICQLLQCRNPEIRSEHVKHEKAIKSQSKNMEGVAQKLGYLQPPLPSIYVDALPKYPRAMEQVYHIIRRWVESISHLRKKYDALKKYARINKKERQKWDDDEKKIIAEIAEKFPEEIVEIEKSIPDVEKELRVLTSQSVKALFIACLGYIPMLPPAFQQRIEFIDNPNHESKHPIQINFDTEGLTNIIKAGGEAVEIKRSTDGKDFRFLRVHPITPRLMVVDGEIKYSHHPEEKATYKIPNEWKYYDTFPEDIKISDENNIAGGEPSSQKTQKKTTKRYHVPDEYFAVYNLADDLTATTGVFGKTDINKRYRMRDGTPVRIFSVRAGTTALFSDCYCAIPRWHRIAEYDLFALAWNDLVRNVSDIVRQLPSDKWQNESILADWVVLSLLRICICVGMNSTPFLVQENEKELVLRYIRDDQMTKDDYKQIAKHIPQNEVIEIIEKTKPKLPQNEQNLIIQGIQGIVVEGLNEKNEQCCEYINKYPKIRQKMYDFLLFSPIKHLVKKGLCSMMGHIRQVAMERALPRYYQALKSWVEYGLPMLSNGDYVSKELGDWIVYQWVMLLITNDDGKDNDPTCGLYQTEFCKNNYKQVLYRKYGVGKQSKITPKADCYSCAYPRLRLIEHMLGDLNQELKLEKHNSHFFLREYRKEILSFHRLEPATSPLRNGLKVFLLVEKLCKSLADKKDVDELKKAIQSINELTQKNQKLVNEIMERLEKLPHKGEPRERWKFILKEHWGGVINHKNLLDAILATAPPPKQKLLDL